MSELTDEVSMMIDDVPEVTAVNDNSGLHFEIDWGNDLKIKKTYVHQDINRLKTPAAINEDLANFCNKFYRARQKS